MKTLLIVNDPPYGTERAYNALRLATSLLKRAGEEAKVFLLGDAASCAKAGQSLPQGYYNLERMLKLFRAEGGRSESAAPAWMRAGSRMRIWAEGRGAVTLTRLTDWTLWADKVLVF
jgi:uncharacterized protein involved in oxidation of intracellular sulfur